MQIGLKCEICNHTEKYNLKYHLEKIHNLNTKEYKKIYPKCKTMTGHSKRTVEYWFYQGYSYDESINKVCDFQKIGKRTFINKLISKGINLDQAQNEWNEKQSNNSKRSIKYYLSRGKSLSESKLEQSKYQVKYSKLSSKFLGHTHSLESKKKISNAVKHQILLEDPICRSSRFYTNKDGYRSRGEIDCYNILKKHFPKILANFKIKTKIADMIINNVVIEYYGDFWHRNPNIYSEGFTMFKKSSKDIWIKDHDRISLFNLNNYRTFIIWESDWVKDFELVINKIKLFINNDTSKNSNTKS